MIGSVVVVSFQRFLFKFVLTLILWTGTGFRSGFRTGFTGWLDPLKLICSRTWKSGRRTKVPEIRIVGNFFVFGGSFGNYFALKNGQRILILCKTYLTWNKTGKGQLSRTVFKSKTILVASDGLYFIKHFLSYVIFIYTSNLCYGWDCNFVVEDCFAFNCILNSFKLYIRHVKYISHMR